MFEWIYSPEAWVALGTLTALEVVLGIDNIVFISILANSLPEEQRERARRIGIAMAMLSRLLLLFSIAWIMGLTATLFSIGGHEFSGRDLVLILGGLFLLTKATLEIHKSFEPTPSADKAHTATTLKSVVIQDCHSGSGVFAGLGDYGNWSG